MLLGLLVLSLTQSKYFFPPAYTVNILKVSKPLRKKKLQDREECSNNII
jgi:hypothetical protein